MHLLWERTAYLYFGSLVPRTSAITGPEFNPTRISTKPFAASSSSKGTSLAAFTASMANSARRLAWSFP